MSKLTKLPLSLIFILTGCLGAFSATVSHADPFSIQATLKQAQALIQQHEPDHAEMLLAKAAHEHHSGLAYLMLGNLQRRHEPQQAIQSYLQAARYGYPNAYQPIGLVYQHGGRGIQADPLLSACYENLAQPQIDQALVQRCDEERAGQFIHYPNEGIQSDEEAHLFAQSQVKNFCQGKSSILLNPHFHRREVSSFRQQLCHSALTHQPAFLKKGDLVLDHDQVFQYESGEQLPYHNELTAGTVVYESQPSYRALIYQKGHFIPAPDGTFVTDSDGQKQVIRQQHLEPVSENLS